MFVYHSLRVFGREDFHINNATTYGGIDDWLKFVVIFAGSLGIIAGVYWFLIRPFNAVRFLFGMRPKVARHQQISTEPQTGVTA